MQKIFLRIKDWFQLHKDQIILFTVIALIAVLSFGLGYLVRGEVKKSPIIIESHT